MKFKVFEAPILRGPNWSLLFHISTNALETPIGFVLVQRDGNDPYTIYYIRKNHFPTKLNYMVREKEFLAVIYAINKFQYYITRYLVVLYTDHAAIKYLMKKPITNGMVIRWLLLIQEYDITILNKPGKDNVVADFLSRLTSNENELPVEDSFPDENLFVISTNFLWFTNITN
jgi:hypothetical protein